MDGQTLLAAIECNYKHIDRHLKKQFINGLNHSDMLVQIIRELTKPEEGSDVTSACILVRAKRVEAKKAQSMIITSLNETKDLDKIKTIEGVQRQYEKNYKHMPKCLQTRATDIVVQAIHPGDVWYMIRGVWSAERSTTLERSAEVE